MALRFSNSGEVREQHGGNDDGAAVPAHERPRLDVRGVHEVEGYTAVPKWRQIVHGLGVYRRCNLAVAGDAVASLCSQRAHGQACFGGWSGGGGG